MNRTFTIEHVYNNMSCFTVMQADFKDRCFLVKAVRHCAHIMSVFKYYQFMYCNVGVRDKVTEMAFTGIFCIIVVFLMVMIAHLVDKYFTPSLKIVAVKMHLNEYLAGITLLSFCNTSPDLITNFMPIRGHAPLFTITMSNALAVILLSGGTVCYLRSFKINGACGLRDLLFLLAAGEILYYMIMTGEKTTGLEATVLVLFYLLYLAVNVTDLKLSRMYMGTLKSQIEQMKSEHSTPYGNQKMQEKETKLLDMEHENILLIHNYKTALQLSSSIRRSTKSRASSLRDIMDSAINVKATRNILHNPNNPKNLFLCVEFFESLMPIDIDEFKLKGWLGRFFLITMIPIVLFCNIFVPVVDYSRDKHGWSKLLNCTQIITAPFVITVLIEALYLDEYTGWYLRLDYNYAIWTFCGSVPLALFVFFMSRTDQPPRYHVLFVIITATVSILLLTIVATELEVLCVIIGVAFNLTESFVATSIRSFAAALADLIMNLDLAMQGYERMAFAAVLAGPFFSLTVGMGFSCLFNKSAQDAGSVHWLTEEHGENSYIFFVLTVFTTLAWTLTFNFCSRRSTAIYSFIMYLLFILYAVLVEWDYIHAFSQDTSIELQ